MQQDAAPAGGKELGVVEAIWVASLTTTSTTVNTANQHTYAKRHRQRVSRSRCVSAPAAELPVMDLDLGEHVKPCPLILRERSDSFTIGRLNTQSNSGWLTAVEGR